MASNTLPENSSKINSIIEIFKNMDYGPVPVGTSLAKEWLKSVNLGPYIDGVWKKTSSQFEVHEPCKDYILTKVGLCTEEDVNMAINSSLKAAELWSKLDAHHRACHLYSLARHIQKHATLLTQIVTLNCGVQSRDPKEFDVPLMVRYLYHYAGWAQLSSTEFSDWKPEGVVAGVISRISPLMTLACIVAPALAAGNTVCLKPSKNSPLPALLFASIAAQSGLPPGVINVLPGGSDTGQLLVSHRQVSKVTFAGSTSVGRLIRKQTAGLGKHLSMLTYGGKAAMLVFDSADVDSAVDGIFDTAWFNEGQVPWSIGKILVQESIWNTFLSKLRIRIDKLRVGENNDYLTDVGSTMDRQVVENCKSALAKALKNNLQIIHAPLPPDLSSECTFPPTLIIGDLENQNCLVDEDILLPLVFVIPFRTPKEAIALSNCSRYGLATSIWTENISLAIEVAYELKVGNVWLNSHGFMDAGVPFTGWKQSGIGTFGGKEGVLEYMQYKGVRKNMTTEVFEYDSFGTTPNLLSCYPSLIDVKNCENPLPKIDCTYKLYYGGAYKRPDGNTSRVIYDNNGKVFTSVADGNRKDIRNAVEAALKAQPAWWKLGAHGRAQILYNTAEKLQFRQEDFVRHLKQIYGDTNEEKAVKEINACLNLLFHWASCCDKKQLAGGDISPNSNVAVNLRREPLGIIGIVHTQQNSSSGPWALLNFILLIAPAVCYGNTVVVITDDKYPTPILEFCQVLDVSDFHPGVVNVLTGESDTLLAILVGHQEVAALWAPGIKSKAAKYIEWASSANLKCTWIDKLPCLDSMEQSKDCRELFELHSTRPKAIWMPCGQIFAN